MDPLVLYLKQLQMHDAAHAWSTCSRPVSMQGESDMISKKYKLISRLEACFFSCLPTKKQ